ncbi:MAG: Xaa-Pro dipeptidase [Wenzhouxiangellaceae bacterium]|nr:Xaa-Pro dipeptidase [Wenzhouxiangellaceae bacterium]
MPHRDRLYRRHFEHLFDRTVEHLAEAGYDRLLIHSGHPRPRFQDDYVPPFRAHPHFVAWLPLPRNPDCLLEIGVGSRPKLWLARPDDFWHAPPAAPEDWWARHFEIELISGPEDWQHVLAKATATALIGEPEDFPNLGRHADLNPEGLVGRLDELRTVKTDWQIECIAAANRIAVAGHRAAVAAFEAGASELEIHLAYLAAAGHDPDTLPYGSIVALNGHAAILHYQYRDNTPPGERRSFLIDAGADCHGYAADVTRTWSAGPGPFRDLVEEMDRRQQHLAGRMQVGRSYVDLHLEAHREIAEVLRGAGICDMAIDAMVADGVTATFLPHGLGHFLGVQVHDIAGKVAPDGQPLPPPDDHAALRLTRRLDNANVLTVEPGLYFIPSLLDKLRASLLSRHLDWKLIDMLVPCGGIRIEDNIVVRLEEPENLTRLAWAANAD